VELDPKFGIGYQGLAALAFNQNRPDEAEKYVKEAFKYLDGMTERERYTTRGLYYTITADYQQCAKDYTDLIAKYPAEVLAHNNLALCLSYLRNMPKAVDEMKRLVDLLPKRALFRINLALYGNYATDFPTGEREGRALLDLGRKQWGLFNIALAQLGQGQLAEAKSSYEELAKTDGVDPSLAASGLGDLAIVEGRFADAVRILEHGAAADLQSKPPDYDKAAAKFAAAGHAQVLRQQKAAAIAAAQKALANAKTPKIRFLAGRIFIEAGDIPRARTLVAGLASEIQAEPQAYAKVLEGEIAMAGGDARAAIKPLTDASTLLDTWIGHLDLGRAYLAAGLFPQADSEFDRCVTRRGEALSLFLDQEPTYGNFPIVYYYQGRVREALQSARAVESYRMYLTIREKAGEDPLLTEVKKRAGK
jgi:tetratricopeptide (TPR) repeat protein